MLPRTSPLPVSINCTFSYSLRVLSGLYHRPQGLGSGVESHAQLPGRRAGSSTPLTGRPVATSKASRLPVGEAVTTTLPSALTLSNLPLPRRGLSTRGDSDRLRLGSDLRTNQAPISTIRLRPSGSTEKSSTQCPGEIAPTRRPPKVKPPLDLANHVSRVADELQLSRLAREGVPNQGPFHQGGIDRRQALVDRSTTRSAVGWQHLQQRRDGGLRVGAELGQGGRNVADTRCSSFMDVESRSSRWSAAINSGIAFRPFGAIRLMPSTACILNERSASPRALTSNGMAPSVPAATAEMPPWRRRPVPSRPGHQQPGQYGNSLLPSAGQRRSVGRVGGQGDQVDPPTSGMASPRRTGPGSACRASTTSW